MRCAGVRSRSVSKLALASFETDLERIPAQRIQAVLVEYKLNDFEDLLEDIGLGNRMALVVARQLMEGSEELELAAQTPENEGPLAIKGTEGLVLSYAKCCTPIPGDPIVGHLSA